MSLGDRFSQWTPQLLAKLQTLLGERGGSGQRAVREQELEKIIEAVYNRMTAQIQASRLVIADRTNMVPNAEFKESCAGWTKLTDGGSTVDSYSGVLGDGITITKAAGALTAGARTEAFDLLPAHSLKPGEQIYISLFVQRQSGADVGTVGLRARVFNSDGTSALVTLVSITSTPVLQTVPLAASYTAPALASGLSFEVFYDAGAGDPAGVVIVTQVLARRRLTGELIVEGTLTADKGVFGIGTNVFPNPNMDFEGAGYVDASAGTSAFGEPYSGPLGRGVRLATPAAGEQALWRSTVDATRPLVSAKPGDQFRLSAKVTANASTASALVGFLIRQFLADGTTVSTVFTSGHAIAMPGAGLSADISALFTVPANVIGLNFRLALQQAATGGNDVTITEIFVRRLADGPDIRADSIIITGPAQMGALTVNTLAIGDNAVTLPLISSRATDRTLSSLYNECITLTNTTDLTAINSPTQVNVSGIVEISVPPTSDEYIPIDVLVIYETQVAGVWTEQARALIKKTIKVDIAYGAPWQEYVAFTTLFAAPPVGPAYTGERFIWRAKTRSLLPATDPTVKIVGDVETFLMSAISFKK